MTSGSGLPPTIDEDLTSKPSAHTLMQMGMTAYMGPLSSRRQQLDYVNFYAYLHRVVDRHIGRLLACLGDPASPDSLRSRTLIVRTSDHGEMGLSHGGLRQKAFNVYEETIHIPLLVSNPALFPQPARSPALASLIDVLPTIATLAGAEAPPGIAGSRPLAGARASTPRRPGMPTLAGSTTARSATIRTPPTRSRTRFTSPTTTIRRAPRWPTRPGSRTGSVALHDGRRKYAVYLDPEGKMATEYEMYDLERDPDERHNLVDVHSGEARSPRDRPLREELGERLRAAMAELGTAVSEAATAVLGLFPARRREAAQLAEQSGDLLAGAGVGELVLVNRPSTRPTVSSVRAAAAPAIASTRRSASCAQAAPNGEGLEPITATGFPRQGRGSVGPRSPVQCVLQGAGDRAVVFGSRHQESVGGGDSLPQIGHRLRRRPLDVEVLVVGGKPGQPLVQLDLRAGRSELLRRAQEPARVGAAAEAARDRQDPHRAALLGAAGLDRQHQAHLLADDRGAVGELAVPADPVVGPVQLADRGEADPVAAVGPDPDALDA